MSANPEGRQDSFIRNLPLVRSLHDLQVGVWRIVSSKKRHRATFYKPRENLGDLISELHLSR